MSNIEYTRMSWLYDRFYAKKDYKKEVNFIKSFMSSDMNSILDVGCGTGTHAKILADLGYNVYGFDINKEMVNIANTKLDKHFFVEDVLKYNKNKKYDLIISFFAVFNHLKNYKEFKIALSNLKNSLKTNGRIIIDLHNPQNNGEKIDKVEDAVRIMKWKYNAFTKKEVTNISYIVRDVEYVTQHVFKIFDIKKLKKIANELGFSSVKFYEDYDTFTTASKTSKNIQMVLSIG